MKMKIKGKFIIPLVAIMIAMFTLGVTPGFAGDTTAKTVSVEDSLTYVPPTYTTEAPLEDQIGGFISGAFGEELENAGESMMETGSVMNALLKSLRNILNSFVKIFERIGLILGNSNINIGGGILG